MPSLPSKSSKADSVSISSFRDTIAQHCIEKFAKKLLGESEIEAVLKRLDRLTQEEGRMTVAQTLEVVHGLMNNVKIVMNGMQRFLGGSLLRN